MFTYFLLQIAALVMAVMFMTPTRAAEPIGMPGIELPEPLKPYTDVESVVETAASIISLLGTAKFDDPPSHSPLSKAPCNTAEITAFYRGMTLMQAGYFIFINKIERGFEAVDSPHFKEWSEVHGWVQPSFGAIVRPGRDLLISVWNHEKRSRLLSIVSAVSNIPPEVRDDLTAYFAVLRDFGQRYVALKRRASEGLADLNERSTDLYRLRRFSEIEMARRRSEWEVSTTEARYPEAIFTYDYAKEMRLLLDKNRDIGMDGVSECLDGSEVAVVRLGEKGEITYQALLVPTSYMIGFWQRRESEGTTALTRFAIDRILKQLARHD